jgi:hypothetical protein
VGFWCRCRKTSAVFALISSISGVSLAESDRDRAAARSAADAGVDAFEQGRYAEAVDLFSRAEQLVHAPPHLLFIARALVKLGRFVDARENYLKITREKLAPTAPAAFKRAQNDAETELAQVQPRIATVTVTVQGDASGAELLMDRVTLPAAMIGIPFPVDPGTHVFAVRAGSDVSQDVTVRLSEGEKQAVRLRLERKAVPVTPSNPAAGEPGAGGGGTLEPAPPPRHESHAVQNGLGIASLAIGAAGVGVGAVFISASGKARQRGNDMFASCNSSFCTDPQKAYIKKQDHDADSRANVAIAGFVVGGVGVLGGILLLTIHGHSSESAETKPGWQLASGPDWIGVKGRF